MNKKEAIANQEMTPLQFWVDRVPDSYSLFLGGSRGSSKTRALINRCMKHVASFPADAHVLFIKNSAKGLTQLVDEVEKLLLEIWIEPAVVNDAGVIVKPAKPLVTRNKQQGVFYFDSGATWSFQHINSMAEYSRKIQGSSVTLVAGDELTAYSDDTLINLCLSNLRSNNLDVPLTYAFAANPGGPGHTVFAERFAFKSKSKTKPTVFQDGDNKCVYIPSSFRDNQFIDSEAYLRKLRASSKNEALLEAWIEGSWNVAVGSWFSGILVEKYNMVPDVPLTDLRAIDYIRPVVSYDHGTKKPAVVMIGAEFMDHGELGERMYRRGDIVVVEEWSTARDDDPTDGGGEQIETIALEILGLCMDWGIPPKVYADDAICADTGQGSIIAAFRRLGVTMVGAGKGKRVPGWQVVASRLQAAHVDPPNITEDPALYITRGCKLFWRTTPSLMVSERDPEDLAKCDHDNSADTLRYMITARRTGKVTFTPSIGNPDFQRDRTNRLISRAVTHDEKIERMRKAGITTADFAKARGGRHYTTTLTRL